MPYATTWDEFAETAQALFLAHPSRTRHSWKYRGKDGVLVLKVTNDVKTVKYRTTSRTELRRLEDLTSWMMERMTAEGVNDEELSVAPPRA